MEIGGGGFVAGKAGEDERGAAGDEHEKDGEFPPQKVQRTDTFPFRMRSLCRSGNGPTFYHNSEGSRLSDLYDVPGSAVAVGAAARTVQPFHTAFKSPGMASLRFPFTSAQWQELEQQALIYKYMMAAIPIPPDLIIPIRKSLANAAITSQTSLGWGSFNLRLAGNTDPEPGRCRRTDGKKWRCSRDVAPDQKYCERHMHRGRPRSRKPVEVQIQDNPPASGQTRSSSISAPSSSAPVIPSGLTCTPSSSLGTKPFQPCGVFLEPSSLPTLVPTVPEKESRYLNWMKGGEVTDRSTPTLMSTSRYPMTANQQLQLLHSKVVPVHQQPRPSNNGNTPILNDQDYLNLLAEPDIRENPHFSGSNSQRDDHHGGPFLGTDLGSLDPDCAQRLPARRFIDAWSQARDSKPSGGKLSLSSLSLSMSRDTGEDVDPTQMGIGVNDSEQDSALKPQPINWMLPVSWQSLPLGGPLAEMLQSSTAAANSAPGSSGKSSFGGGLNLMSDGWGELSPRTSPKLVSSPTGVLQKTLASLSDSSSGSSPSFAAKPEFALQWLNQHPKLPSS